MQNWLHLPPSQSDSSPALPSPAPKTPSALKAHTTSQQCNYLQQCNWVLPQHPLSDTGPSGDRHWCALLTGCCNHALRQVYMTPSAGTGIQHSPGGSLDSVLSPCHMVIVWQYRPWGGKNIWWKLSHVLNSWMWNCLSHEAAVVPMLFQAEILIFIFITSILRFAKCFLNSGHEAHGIQTQSFPTLNHNATPASYDKYKWHVLL